MSKWKSITLSIVLGLYLLVLLALLNVQIVSYDQAFYVRQLLQLERDTALGTTEADIAIFSQHTTRYLMGLGPDPNVQMQLYGQQRWLLNEKEIAHMQDVQQLFRLARFVSCAMFIGFIGLIALAKRRRTVPKLLSKLANGIGYIMIIGLIAALAISRDFTRAFDLFHHLAFTNDLWLLDPSTDQLINLLPEAFFAAAALRTALLTGALLLLAAVLSYYLSKRSAATLR